MQVRALSPRQPAQPQLWLQVTLNLPNALQPVFAQLQQDCQSEKKGNVETAMVIHWALSLCRAPQGCLSNLTLPCAVILLRSIDEKHAAREGTACSMSHSHSGPGEDSLSFRGGGESQFHDSCASSAFLVEVTNSLWSQDKVGKERCCHSKWSLALYHAGLGTAISRIRLLLFWEWWEDYIIPMVGKVLRTSLRFHAGKK